MMSSDNQLEIHAEQIQEFEKKLQKKLTAKRYRHTMGVAYTAASLAMAHGESVYKAFVAGLLHDNAKCIDGDKKIHLCEKYKLPISEVERKNPELLHAKLGSCLAKKDYGIEDDDILNAISSHTTGRPDMSRLEKIIFVADYIEPNRKSIPNLEQVRAQAFSDLDKAVLEELGSTLSFVRNKTAALDPITQETYEFYKQICK